MKTKILVASLIAAAAVCGLAQNAAASGTAKFPPVVVSTWPENGSQNVAPGVTELKVTFDRAMRDRSYSWCSERQDGLPESLEKPSFAADHKTCVWKVRLEPSKTYHLWLNNERFKNFIGTNGVPAVPYSLTFRTKQQ
jgi:hypothetical protein